MKTMRIEEIRDGYFTWLVNLIRPETLDFDYFHLCSYLSDIKFELPDKHHTMDVNRITDALDLRADFIGYLSECDVYVPVGTDKHFFNQTTPSVFEVLVALARRIERDIMYDNEKGDRTHKWFWIMMDNLDLTRARDNGWYKEYEDFVSEKIDIWMHHKFGSNGKGSLFPLDNPNIDQTKLDIWSQMTNYLSEKGDDI